MNAKAPPRTHAGRSIKRFPGMHRQEIETLAYGLCDDWNQKRISQLESCETIEPDILEEA